MSVSQLALIACTHLRILANPTATTGAAAIQDGADADCGYEEGEESDNAEFQDDPLVEAGFRGSLECIYIYNPGHDA